MTKPKHEIAEIFRENHHLLGKLSNNKKRVIENIINCRTAALGGHIYQCDNCDHDEISYNSCCNRHCPKCQHATREKWVKKRMEEVLPVPYYHVVFTLPHIFNELILTNPKVIYNLLLEVSSQTIKDVFKQQYNSAEPGIISVLHTWGQNLSLHPHVHMVIPSGGLADKDTRWEKCKTGKTGKKNYFLPIKVLSKIFRARFTKRIKELFDNSKLTFLEVNGYLDNPTTFQDLLDKAYKTEWVVYAKSPFKTPHAVLRYLGNYTHRIAFANHRIIAIENGMVRFHYKDYRSGNNGKSYNMREMTLSIAEFMRRFLMHVMPRGFTRMRYYGFLASARKKKALASANKILQATKEGQELQSKLTETLKEFKKTGDEVANVCCVCRVGKMVLCYEIKRPVKKRLIDYKNTS